MKFPARLALIALGALAAAAASPTKPDLLIEALDVAPDAAAGGAEVEVVSTVINAGKRTKAAVDVDVGFFTRATDAAPLAPLTGWTKPKGLRRDESVSDATRVAMPRGFPVGGYYVCADVDPDDAVSESDEANNRLCTMVSLSPSPGGPLNGADLVIESVTGEEWVQASRKVRIKIKNAGVAAASAPFKIKAFKRGPRAPIYLTSCPLTEGQLAAGSPSGCPDLSFDAPLEPGAVATLDGFLNYVVSGAEFVTEPVKPGYQRPLVVRTVDFMVDGCFPPIDASAVWCAINEIDEINNFKTATLKLR